MISLISRWKLRDGCAPGLLDGIGEATAAVEKNEPGTLMYSVHLPARNPLAAFGRPIAATRAIPLADQAEVVFFEIYEDADAFSAHLGGAAFRSFLDRYLHCFYTDPANPEMPLTETLFLDRQAAFVRPAAGGPDALHSQLTQETES
jgi:quinol monooxygenase YgiN